ncbi:TNF receptor-associated factor 5-like [Littorina saxatilis]|uniref:Uncharacterized protein n=1 Tax=Littorina saxatilis TaxID=31220 RepID=A0AAN9BDI8_9CAEN
MGFGTQRFVSDVDPNLVCGVCGGVLEDAVVTPCGHSFCSLCLRTWLARPAALTCPECRAHVPETSVKPVHCLRNLIRGLEVECDFARRGCKSVVKLDCLQGHLNTCPFAPVECAGCGEEVSRLDLADHQMTCAGIAATVQEEEDDEGDSERLLRGEEGSEENQRFDSAWREFRERVQMCKSASSTDICILLSRIRALETRVERLLEELRTARSKNLALEREYEKINVQLREKQSEIRELQDTEFFLEHECARTPETVARLSLLIAHNLLKKPRFLEPEKVFSAVRRCYDKFFRVRPDCEHDVHMLLATAYASNWFSTCHRLSLKRWLQTLTRPAARTGSILFNRQLIPSD